MSKTSVYFSENDNNFWLFYKKHGYLILEQLDYDTHNHYNWTLLNNNELKYNKKKFSMVFVGFI
jgi:hypothetical protein